MEEMESRQAQRMERVILKDGMKDLDVLSNDTKEETTSKRREPSAFQRVRR